MSTEPTRLVILGRDGVINRDSSGSIKSPDEWIPLPGSLEAIARLNHVGFSVVVATNQPGVGRGLFSIGELNAIHAKFHRALGRIGGHIEGIFFCPHAPDDGCRCRKPQPGLFEAIAKRCCGLPLDGVPVVGNSSADAEAALSVGARPIMVRTGQGGHCYDNHPELHSLPWFDNLADAACHILERSPTQ